MEACYNTNTNSFIVLCSEVWEINESSFLNLSSSLLLHWLSWPTSELVTPLCNQYRPYFMLQYIHYTTMDVNKTLWNMCIELNALNEGSVHLLIISSCILKPMQQDSVNRLPSEIDHSPLTYIYYIYLLLLISSNLGHWGAIPAPGLIPTWPTWTVKF